MSRLHMRLAVLLSPSWLARKLAVTRKCALALGGRRLRFALRTLRAYIPFVPVPALPKPEEGAGRERAATILQSHVRRRARRRTARQHSITSSGPDIILGKEEPPASPVAAGAVVAEPSTDEAPRGRPPLEASSPRSLRLEDVAVENLAGVAAQAHDVPPTAPTPCRTIVCAAPLRAPPRALPRLPSPARLPPPAPIAAPRPLPPLKPLPPLPLSVELALRTTHGLEGAKGAAAEVPEPTPDVPRREARRACSTFLEVEAASAREATSRAAALAATTFHRALEGQHAATRAPVLASGGAPLRRTGAPRDRAIAPRSELDSWEHERRVERRRREMDKAGGPAGAPPPAPSDAEAPPQPAGQLGWPPEEYRAALEATLAPSRAAGWGQQLCENLALHHQLRQLPRRSMGRRHIPGSPERILDAPEIRDDFYMNILDWSPDIGHAAGVVAVALDSEVYLWDASDGGIRRLLQTEGVGSHVTSLAWATRGPTIAVGTSTNEVQLWDVERLKRVRVMEGHEARVSSLSWNGGVLSSGGRDSLIIHHDVRAPCKGASSRAGTLRGHTQEICGLKWSPSGAQLASGGNDNLLHIWDGRYDQPVFRLCHHRAAVRALAWCPWQRGLLASGGGTHDKTIRFWSSANGRCQRSVDAGAQVCALQWAKHDRELVSSLGYSYNEVVIWKYPSLVKVARLCGHTRRVLHMAQSPDGTTIVTAAADETLRFWKVLSGPRAKDDEARARETELGSWSSIR